MSFYDYFSPLEINLNGVRLPEIKIEKHELESVGLKSDISNFDFLRALTLAGFRKLNLKKGDSKYTQYVDRVKKELATFEELGITDYVLLIWRVIDFCKKNDIGTGAGRGSAAGSLVLFLISVTRIDPIKHGLYFERFISKARAKRTVVDNITYFDGSLLPDVDLDIDYFRRGEVIKYLETVYENKTCKISTFNTLSGKLLIKECGKIIEGKKESEMTYVAGMIPKIFGKVRDIQEAKNGVIDKNGEVQSPPVKDFSDWCDANPRVYDVSLKLRNLIKNKSVHPSAILVSYHPIDTTVPTETTSKGELVCSYDMNSASITSVKLDALGLRCVSVIDRCCKLIGVDPEKLDYEDPFIYQALQDFKSPHGIFQLEADCNYEVTRKVKPRNIEELSAVLALARPGALSFVDNYAKFTNHNQIDLPDVDSDKLKEILSETGGCLLFQETLMRIGHEVFKIGLEDVEGLRRCVGKKAKDKMMEYKALIDEKGMELSIPKSAKFYWDALIASADYSFNRSHSTSYASLSATTIYLKYKYPSQFFLALLRMTREEQNPTEEINKIEKEMKRFGLKLLPPHIIKSKLDFSIEDGNIRFGLTSIKGISEKTIEKLDSFRHGHKNKFELFKAARDSKIPINVLVSLIQVGALEDYPQSRSWITLEAQTWNILTEKEQKAAIEHASEYDHNLITIIPELVKKTNEKGKPVIKDSRFETIKKKYNPFKLIYKQNSKAEDFAKWFYEMKLIGYSYGKRLVDIYNSKMPSLIPIEEALAEDDGTRIVTIGQVLDVQKGITRAKGARYVRCVVSDEAAEISVSIFNDKIDTNEELNGNKAIKEGDFVIVKGTRKGEDSVFADTIAVQNNQIFMKLSQVKDVEFEIDDMKEFDPTIFVRKERLNEDSENLFLKPS
jgi:DNA polymerase-3 subunit alpha